MLPVRGVPSIIFFSVFHLMVDASFDYEGGYGSFVYYS